MRVGFLLYQAMRVAAILAAAILVTACQAPEPPEGQPGIQSGAGKGRHESLREDG
jgi:hypothetical protein